MKVHKFHLHSADRTSGTTSNSNFLIQYPLNIKNGRVYVENLFLDSAGIGEDIITVKSNNLYNKYGFDTKGISDNVILTLNIVDETLQGTNVHFLGDKQQSGLTFNNLNFDGNLFNIHFDNIAGADIPAANINDWNLVLVIEEFD